MLRMSMKSELAVITCTRNCSKMLCFDNLSDSCDLRCSNCFNSDRSLCKHTHARAHIGGPQKGTFLYALELIQILNNFQTFFTFRIRRKFVTVPSLKKKPHVCRYTTLKATTENKTTSVTTHFKSASSRRKADTFSIWRKTAGCDSYFRQQLSQ